MLKLLKWDEERVHVGPTSEDVRQGSNPLLLPMLQSLQLIPEKHIY